MLLEGNNNHTILQGEELSCSKRYFIDQKIDSVVTEVSRGNLFCILLVKSKKLNLEIQILSFIILFLSFIQV